MDFTQYVLLGAVIAGATELITRIRAKDWWVVLTICVAAIIGGLFGLGHYYPDLDLVRGIVVGLGTSGAIAAWGGGKSKASPSDPLTK
jgi:peptidoglycan/LPS O-acetylase OafA/YrhL